MIPAPDFRVEIVIDITEEVVRMGFATIGFAIAVWGMIKIISIIAKANQKEQPDGVKE